MPKKKSEVEEVKIPPQDIEVEQAVLGALFLGFSGTEAASIGIIGGADGPTSIFLSSQLAPHLLGPIAIAAYSYMALVPLIQPPIMKIMTTWVL